jgi:hypothetical protein
MGRQHHVDPTITNYSLDDLQVAKRVGIRARAGMQLAHPSAEPSDTQRVRIERLDVVADPP